MVENLGGEDYRRGDMMKIAVSATDKSLDANVDPRFGRCPYFVIVETEGNKIKKHEVVENKSVGAMRGAGIQAAQTVANKEAEVVITGNIGPNSFQVLSTTGIKIVTGVSGNVKEAIEKYLKGELKETSSPTTFAGRGMGGGRRWRK